MQHYCVNDCHKYYVIDFSPNTNNKNVDQRNVVHVLNIQHIAAVIGMVYLDHYVQFCTKIVISILYNFLV